MAQYLRNSKKENKRLWGIYHGMKKRCMNKNDARYKDSFSRLCSAHDLNPSTVYDRIHKFGWSLEDALNTPTQGRGANSMTYNPLQFGKGKCAICGCDFIRNNRKQIYCGERCRGISKRHSFRRTGEVFDGRKTRCSNSDLEGGKVL